MRLTKIVLRQSAAFLDGLARAAPVAARDSRSAGRNDDVVRQSRSIAG
jgi:hypothetical protein